MKSIKHYLCSWMIDIIYQAYNISVVFTRSDSKRFKGSNAICNPRDAAILQTVFKFFTARSHSALRCSGDNILALPTAEYIGPPKKLQSSSTQKSRQDSDIREAIIMNSFILMSKISCRSEGATDISFKIKST